MQQRRRSAPVELRAQEVVDWPDPRKHRTNRKPKRKTKSRR